MFYCLFPKNGNFGSKLWLKSGELRSNRLEITAKMTEGRFLAVIHYYQKQEK